MTKESKPSSLHHYTSMKVLAALLNNAIEKEDPKRQQESDRYLRFQATSIYGMNDKLEGQFPLNRKHLSACYLTKKLDKNFIKQSKLQIR